MNVGNIIDGVKRYYRMPMRRGALMSRGEVRAAYLYLCFSIALVLMFAMSLGAAEREGTSGFWTLVCWSLVVLFGFATTIYASSIYGYHHRHEIETDGETPVDLSRAYLGGVIAAIAAPILRWVISLFGG